MAKRGRPESEVADIILTLNEPSPKKHSWGLSLSYDSVKHLVLRDDSSDASGASVTLVSFPGERLSSTRRAKKRPAPLVVPAPFSDDDLSPVDDARNQPQTSTSE